MTYYKRHFSVLCWLFLCAAILSFAVVVPVSAQTTNNNNNNSNNNNNNNNNSNSNNNNGSSDYGGVIVSAGGVLQRSTVLDAGQLSRRQLNAARSAYSLSRDVAAPSRMRCVSLNRLEKSIVNANGKIDEEMKYLAGLQQIRYVFYFPESKDIVIAGPAEGWFPGYEGAMIGQNSLQPVCELQDFVVALRAYAPQKEGADVVGCSIDPTAEGNIRLQQFLKEYGAVGGRERYDAFVKGIRESIGQQTIRIDGIPANTHAAQIMVAADYRMKRIGLGADPAPVRLETFISKTVPGASDALFRWYFVPDYESVILTEDRTGLELVGNGVKLVGENEVVSSTGERTAQPGQLDPGSAAFTRSFTRQYPQLAQRALVFAQLRNWIDMLICAAHIRQEMFYDKSGWSMEFFGSEEKYPLETYNAPKEVEPLVGQVKRRNVLMAPVGGGVVIEAETALDGDHAKTDTNRIMSIQGKVKIDLPENVWWWDVR